MLLLYVRAPLLPSLIPRAWEAGLPLSPRAHCSLPCVPQPNTRCSKRCTGNGEGKSEKKGTSARYSQAQGWKGKGAAPKRAQ